MNHDGPRGLSPLTLRSMAVRLAMVASVMPIAACSSGTANSAAYVPPPQSQTANETSTQPLLTTSQTESVDTSRAVTASIATAISTDGTTQQLFYDDFNADALDVLASGWSRLSGSWQTCRPPGHSTKFCQTALPSSISRPTLVGQSSWSDYTLDSEAFRDSRSNSHGGIMIMGRVVDAYHFYALELRPDIAGSGREFWYIHRYDEHGWNELTGGPFAVHANPYYRLRMNVSGNRISAYVAYDFSSSYQPLGSVTDSAFSHGGIALRTWNNAQEHFDNVRVTTGQAGSPVPVVPTTSPVPSASPNPTAKPTSIPSAIPSSAPTVRPTSAPTMKPTMIPTPAPSTAPATPPPGQRTMAFDSNVGSAYEQTSRGYGEVQPPTFSGHAPRCTSAEYPQCSGQTGAAIFHITRPSLTNNGGSWRSMQTLLPHPIEPNAMYDVAFRTTTNSPQDVPGSQNLIFQVHPNPGNVNTALGLENDGTGGTYWYMNTANVLGLGANAPYGRHRTWQAPYVVGETDDWEIQFKNTADSSGFVYLYRNGTLVDKYDGPNVVPTTSYTELGWGIYEFHWQNSTASNALSESITFQNMRIYKIPGPVSQITSF